MQLFVKLDLGILDSSLWSESAEICKVFLTMLAMSDENGMCRSTLPGISSRSKLPVDTVKHALEVLSSPDPESRSLDQEGRRIERVDGGYFLVNYLKYREMRAKEDRKEQVRIAVAKHRANVISGKQCKPNEKESEKEKEKRTTTLLPPGATQADPEGFAEFWDAWPRHKRKVDRKGCASTFRSIRADKTLQAAIVAHVKASALSWDWTKADGEYIPAPRVWLNQRRWEAPAGSPNPPTSAPSGYGSRSTADDAQKILDQMDAREAGGRG